MPTICFISDTHNQHKRLQLPDTDILIHAGDVSGRGHEFEVMEFMEWYEAQPHPHKILIAGNHDFLAERNPKVWDGLIPGNVIYLRNEACEVLGLKIWGSPITPWFYDWAFNRRRGADIRRYWEKIPEDTDILVTHGPPKGFGEKVNRGGEHVGCEDLLEFVEMIRPKYHVFGHIHEGYGRDSNGDTVFVNASVLDVGYNLVNDPVVVEIGAGEIDGNL